MAVLAKSWITSAMSDRFFSQSFLKFFQSISRSLPMPVVALPFLADFPIAAVSSSIFCLRAFICSSSCRMRSLFSSSPNALSFAMADWAAEIFAWYSFFTAAMRFSVSDISASVMSASARCTMDSSSCASRATACRFCSSRSSRSFSSSSFRPAPVSGLYSSLALLS